MTVGTCSCCGQEKNLRMVRGKPICARCYRLDIINRKEGQRKKYHDEARSALERIDNSNSPPMDSRSLEAAGGHNLIMEGGFTDYFDRLHQQQQAIGTSPEHQNSTTLDLISNLSKLPLSPFPQELVRYLTHLQQELQHQQQRTAWQETTKSKIHKRIASVLDKKVEVQENMVTLLSKRLSSLARREVELVEQINKQLELMKANQLELDRDLRVLETELVRKGTNDMMSSSSSASCPSSPSEASGEFTLDERQHSSYSPPCSDINCSLSASSSSSVGVLPSSSLPFSTQFPSSSSFSSSSSARSKRRRRSTPSSTTSFLNLNKKEPDPSLQDYQQPHHQLFNHQFQQQQQQQQQHYQQQYPSHHQFHPSQPLLPPPPVGLMPRIGPLTTNSVDPFTHLPFPLPPPPPHAYPLPQHQYQHQPPPSPPPARHSFSQFTYQQPPFVSAPSPRSLSLQISPQYVFNQPPPSHYQQPQQQQQAPPPLPLPLPLLSSVSSPSPLPASAPASSSSSSTSLTPPSTSTSIPTSTSLNPIKPVENDPDSAMWRDELTKAEENSYQKYLGTSNGSFPENHPVRSIIGLGLSNVDFPDMTSSSASAGSSYPSVASISDPSHQASSSSSSLSSSGSLSSLHHPIAFNLQPANSQLPAEVPVR